MKGGLGRLLRHDRKRQKQAQESPEKRFQFEWIGKSEPGHERGFQRKFAFS
jgi:hypothetical protein